MTEFLALAVMPAHRQLVRLAPVDVVIIAF